MFVTHIIEIIFTEDRIILAVYRCLAHTLFCVENIYPKTFKKCPLQNFCDFSRWIALQ